MCVCVRVFGSPRWWQLTGTEWKALSEEEKAKYEQEAVKDRARYEKECEERGIEPKKPKEKKEEIRTKKY